MICVTVIIDYDCSVQPVFEIKISVSRRSYLIKQLLNIKITTENFSIAGIIMSKTMQNLVFLMDSNGNPCKTPLTAGNMFLNKFCIDEEANFELSEVTYLKKYTWNKIYLNPLELREKGKEYSFLRF